MVNGGGWKRNGQMEQEKEYLLTSKEGEVMIGAGQPNFPFFVVGNLTLSTLTLC
jgi:hypothetical protein